MTTPNTIDITQFVPYDKSYLMRTGLLDLKHGRTETLFFLAGSKIMLPDDLKKLMNALLSFPREKEPVNVGESATLLRFLRFLSWMLGTERTLIVEGTLIKRSRKITNDPSIISWPLSELINLESSQWASAAVLLRDNEQVPENAQYRLLQAFEAKRDWLASRDSRIPWKPKLDATIQKQAEAYTKHLRGGEMEFTPVHSEDYCFARAFRLVTSEEGLRRWPTLVDHESNRIKEMERALAMLRMNRPIFSLDHRVVQAIAMFARARQIPVRFTRPQCVSKSWPMFWDFLNAAPAL